MDTSFLQNKRNFTAVVAVVGLVAAALTAVLLGAGPEEVAYSLGGGVVTALIVVGTYVAGRRYGHPHSHAVAEASIAFGTVYLIAVTFLLLTEFGQRSTTEVVIGLAATLVGTVAFIAAVVALERIGPSPN